MDTFVRKIFEGRVDERVHMQFQKFSKGVFKNRAVVSASKTSKGYNIGTSHEYGNDLVIEVAKKLKDGESVKVTGAIVCTMDLDGEIKFEDKKQFQGVKRYLINSEMAKEKIIGLCERFPKAFIALSFSVGDTELKIKPKAPKSGKPATSGDKEIKGDFCKIKTKDLEIVKAFLFDIGEFKKVNINHEFFIEELEIPKDETDPVKMRENTVRKGRIVRKIKADGEDKVSEKYFEA